MALKGDFTQKVTVDGQALLVSDLSVRESDSEPVGQIDFGVKVDVQTTAALDALQLDAEVIITQSAQGRSITWRAFITDLRIERQDHSDVYQVKCLGEADLLTRRRFTAYNPDLHTGTEIITEVLNTYASYSGISDAGIGVNTARVGVLSARQDTPMALIDRAAKMSGWTWGVENGVLYYRDPDTYLAPFSLQSGVNIERSGYQFSEDVKGVQNVLRAEAYEYKEVVYEATVNGCTRLLFGEKQGPEWEYAGQARITAPVEVADLQDIEPDPENEVEPLTIDVNPLEGRVEFSQPLILPSKTPNPIPEGWQPEKQQFVIKVKYTVRRKMVVERRDAGSISLYGERHGVYRPSQGPGDIESVFDAMGAEMARKAFPTTRASASIVDFGLRAGMVVSVLPFGRAQSLPMRVSTVRHVTNGSDMSISVDLATRTYAGADPVPELFSRVENLEKGDLDPESPSGIVIRETGEIGEVPTIQEKLTWTEEVEFFVAGQATFSGGGELDLVSSPYGGEVVHFLGGGELSFNPGAVIENQVHFEGGGELKVTRQIDFQEVIRLEGGGELSLVSGAYQTEVVHFEGGGEMLTAGQIVVIPDGTRVAEDDTTARVAEDGSTYRVVESAT